MEVFQGHQEAGMVLLPKLEAVAVEIEYHSLHLNATNLHFLCSLRFPLFFQV